MDFDRDNGDGVVSELRVNIQRLSSQVREMESWIPRITSDAPDGEKNREHFNALATEANKLAKETNRQMQKLVQLSNSNRSMRVHRERLTDELMQILNRLQTAQRSAERAQKEGVKRMRYSAEQDEEERRRMEEAASVDTARQHQMREMNRVSAHELRQRTEALQELERDIADVQTIFTDLARIVHEQGEMVESIEENVDSAHAHVESGASQLQQAVYYQSKARQKKLMLCIFLTILLFIVGLTVWFYARH